MSPVASVVGHAVRRLDALDWVMRASGRSPSQSVIPGLGVVSGGAPSANRAHRASRRKRVTYLAGSRMQCSRGLVDRRSTTYSQYSPRSRSACQTAGHHLDQLIRHAGQAPTLDVAEVRAPVEASRRRELYAWAVHPTSRCMLCGLSRR